MTRIFTKLLLLAIAATLLLCLGCSSEPEVFRSEYFGDLVLKEGDDLDYIYHDAAVNLRNATIQVMDFEMLAPEPEDEADEDDQDDVRWADAGKRFKEIIIQKATPEIKPKYGIAFTSGGADYVMKGRILEFNRGSRAARFFVGFGAGSGYLTFDMKIMDKSGKIVLAAHHKRLAARVYDDLVDLMNDVADDELPDLFKTIFK